MRNAKTATSTPGSDAGGAVTAKGTQAAATTRVGTDSEQGSLDEPLKQLGGISAETFAALVDEPPPIDWAAEDWTLGRTPGGL